MNIILADDHKLIRDGLVPFLNELGPSVHIQEAGTFDELQSAGQGLDQIHLILTDLDMPGMKGAESLHMLLETYPGVPLVVLSGTIDSHQIHQAIDAGISGFIPKSAGSKILLSALQLVLSGERFVPTEFLASSNIYSHPNFDTPGKTGSMDAASSDLSIVDIERFDCLSPRELGVLNLLAGGMTNKEIAREISVQEATIKIHVKNIYRKIGASNRAQAVRMALQPDWTAPS